MTNEQILKKAIEKASKNGYIPPKTWEAKGYFKVTFASPYEIIFSHDWAKHFWGEEILKGSIRTDTGICEKRTPKWQCHLQQMVLLSDDEKFKYIKKFL